MLVGAIAMPLATMKSQQQSRIQTLPLSGEVTEEDCGLRMLELMARFASVIGIKMMYPLDTVCDGKYEIKTMRIGI